MEKFTSCCYVETSRSFHHLWIKGKAFTCSSHSLGGQQECHIFTFISIELTRGASSGDDQRYQAPDGEQDLCHSRNHLHFHNAWQLLQTSWDLYRQHLLRVPEVARLAAAFYSLVCKETHNLPLCLYWAFPWVFSKIIGFLCNLLYFVT